MRVKVDTSLPIADLMAMGMSRATAYKARKRGWYSKGYHTPEVNIDNSKFDADIAYIAARSVWDQKIYPQFVKLEENKRLSRPTRRAHKYEYVQEAVIRCWQLSGVAIKKENAYSFYYQVAHNTMRNLLKKRDRVKTVPLKDSLVRSICQI